MKKILSVLLISLLLGQNLVLAANNDISSAIDCSKNTDDSICKSINIKKEQIKLVSYLRKYSDGYSYTITNKNEYPIEVIELKNFRTTYDAISNYKRIREYKRFPGNLDRFFLAVICPLSLTSVDVDAPDYEDLNVLGILTIYNAYVDPAIKTALTPYFLIKDPRDDEKAFIEAGKFKKNIDAMIINPNEKEQFEVLLEKKINAFTGNQIACVVIRDTKTEKIYKIEK